MGDVHAVVNCEQSIHIMNVFNADKRNNSHLDILHGIYLSNDVLQQTQIHSYYGCRYGSRCDLVKNPTSCDYKTPLTQILWNPHKDCGLLSLVNTEFYDIIIHHFLCWWEQWLVVNWPSWVEIKSTAKTFFSRFLSFYHVPDLCYELKISSVSITPHFVD